MLATCRREFPRLNGYVLIPHEAGATVAYISWMATITVVDVRAISQADYRLLIAIGGKEREFYARRVGNEDGMPVIGTFEPPSFADVPMDVTQFRQLMRTIIAVHSGDTFAFPIELHAEHSV